MFTLSSTHFSSSRSSARTRVQRGSHLLFACLALQLSASACSKDGTNDAKPSAAARDAEVDDAANGGSENVDAGSGAASKRDAAAQAESDAGSSDKAAADAGSPNKTENGEGKTPARDVDFDMTKFSRSLAAAVCKSLLDCLGEQKLRAFVSGDDCEARFAAGYAQGDFGTLQDSLRRGRIELHPEALEQCYAETRALGCELQTKRLPASCQAALKGKVASGDTCTSGADCADHNFCPSTACPRVCSAPRAAAQSCKRDEECESGLICAAGKCAAPAAIGEACAGASGGVCALGTSCVGSTTDKAGKCQANRDVQIGELAEVCTPGGSLCKEGLSCAYDGDQGFNCQAAAEAGAACHLALPTQCPTDQYCTAQDVTTDGTCSALPKDGEACVLGSQCAGGHVCMKAGEKDTVCKRVRDLGEACDADAMCHSGRCASSKCAAAEVCE